MAGHYCNTRGSGLVSEVQRGGRRRGRLIFRLQGVGALTLNFSLLRTMKRSGLGLRALGSEFQV